MSSVPVTTTRTRRVATSAATTHHGHAANITGIATGVRHVAVASTTKTMRHRDIARATTSVSLFVVFAATVAVHILTATSSKTDLI